MSKKKFKIEDLCEKDFFTPTELKVITMIVNGKTTKDISDKIKIGVKSVDRIVYLARKKTPAVNAAHFAGLLVQAGVVKVKL
jgi:DNA-binding CsgD family transcriptional regulator